MKFHCAAGSLVHGLTAKLSLQFKTCHPTSTAQLKLFKFHKGKKVFRAREKSSHKAQTNIRQLTSFNQTFVTSSWFFSSCNKYTQHNVNNLWHSCGVKLLMWWNMDIDWFILWDWLLFSFIGPLFPLHMYHKNKKKQRRKGAPNHSPHR